MKRPAHLRARPRGRRAAAGAARGVRNAYAEERFARGVTQSQNRYGPSHDALRGPVRARRGRGTRDKW